MTIGSGPLAGPGGTQNDHVESDHELSLYLAWIASSQRDRTPVFSLLLIAGHSSSCGGYEQVSE